MLEIDEATFDRVFNVNVKSIFHMTRAVVPLMRQRGGGSIINIGSTAGIRPRPGLTWYNASKGAVNLLSKSMAAELGPDNIRVNAICPVMGATGLIEQFLGVPDTPENRAKVIAGIPLACPRRRTLPTPRFGWPVTPRSSSQAWNCRWTAVARSDRYRRAGDASRMLDFTCGRGRMGKVAYDARKPGRQYPIICQPWRQLASRP